MTFAAKPFTHLNQLFVILALCLCGTCLLAIPAAAQDLRGQDVVLDRQNATIDIEEARGDDTIAAQGTSLRRGGDNFRSPKAADRFERRQKALAQKIAGKQSGKVAEVAKGQYVELSLEKNDRIFVLLVEYGTKASTNPNVSAAPGPLHNQIPEPDRAVDNNTIWQPDYNSDHYRNMYFTKMVDYYRTQSSGRYTINGSVTEWVKVPFNGPRYGSNLLGDAAAWTLIADAINIWTSDQLASGKTLDEVKAYLQTFDTWDRYDYDHDGNFDEPDGYIDHFQIVHSGAGEETGGSILGADAIWSHRWQAWYNRAGIDGPAFNKDGGVEFGGGWGANPTGSTAGSSGAAVSSANPTTAATVTYAHSQNRTGIWVGDYTIQPENGGLGVFAHEYGHDLGLPDHYDTNGGSNSTGFWTIMSSGSYLGDGTVDIGAKPGDFNAWDKLQLGWLNYEVGSATGFSSHRLGPAETNTKAAQAVIVPLPVSANVFYLYDPAVGSLAYGSNAFWGGKGDNIDTNMVRQIAIPPGTTALTMRLNYQIETNWDYAYVSISTDNGANWTNLAGTWPGGAGGAQIALTTNSNPNGQNFGNGITGTSNGAWRLATFNVAPYAGQTVLLRIRYWTDLYVNHKGIMADEITLGGFYDGAEADTSAWTFQGFKVTKGIENSNAPHYYIAEFRQYRTYDAGLRTGPYTFGEFAFPERVTHYPYQDGLLVTYWDSGESNNNTSLHRGEGLILPVDAHPAPLLRNVEYPGQAAFQSPWSSTVQSYDSTFGLQPTDPLNLPFYGSFNGSFYQFYASHPSLPAVPEFNDLNSYWSAAKPDAGVIVPNTGTIIRVVSSSTQDSFMQVHVDHVK